MKNKFFTYENKLLSVMSLTFGLVFVDRMAILFLSPFIIKDLGLNNTQIGMLASGLALTWALSGYFTTAWAEAKNKKKIVFVLAIVLFSVSSVLSGLATTFTILLLTRIFMGLFEGPVLPLIQSFMAKESSKNRLGFNMGFLQSFGSTLFGFVIAPLLLVFLAEKFGWRTTFFIVGIPGLLFAFINWKVLRKSTVESHAIINEKSLSLKELWQYKNIRIAVYISCCMMTWMTLCLAFLPKFLTEVQQMSETQMGNTIGIMGLSSILSGIIIPTLSDKFGRKPIILIASILGIFYPLAILFMQNGVLQIPVMFIGYFFFGAMPIVFAAIPSETIPMHSTGKAIGMIVGAGEIVGGVIMPIVAGVFADKFGMTVPFILASTAAVIAVILSFSLIESRKTSTEHVPEAAI